MKHVTISLFIFFFAALAPLSAQTHLRLPAGLFAATQAVTGQVPAAPVLPSIESSGPRVSLTLEDAVKRALENNLDITVQRINQQTYDVALASIRSVYSPTMNSTLSSQSSKIASTSTIAGAAAGQAITNSTLVFNGGFWSGG